MFIQVFNKLIEQINKEVLAKRLELNEQQVNQVIELIEGIDLGEKERIMKG